jgi:hypothetical protein
VTPTQLKKPITESSTPSSLSQAESVENTNKKGRPAEKPKKIMPSTRGSVYIAKAARQLLKTVIYFASQ